jgi:hypothetical protein
VHNVRLERRYLRPSIVTIRAISLPTWRVTSQTRKRWVYKTLTTCSRHS